MAFELAIAQKALKLRPMPVGSAVLKATSPSGGTHLDDIKNNNFKLKPVSPITKSELKHDPASVAEHLLQTMNNNPAFKLAYHLAEQLGRKFAGNNANAAEDEEENDNNSAWQ